MKFNETGTLINWQLDDIDIIEPLHSKKGGGSRGGVYLCIPNFEELSPPLALNTANIGQLLPIVRCHTKKTFQLLPNITGEVLRLLPIGKKSKNTKAKHLK